MRKTLLLALLALVGPVAAFPQQTGSAEESRAKVEWQERLREAKGRRSSGLIITISGAGIAVAGLALTVTANETYRYTDQRYVHEVWQRRNTARLAAGIAVTGVGSGLAIFGARRYTRAGAEVRELEALGRDKGYLRVGPAPNGLGASLSYVF